MTPEATPVMTPAVAMNPQAIWILIALVVVCVAAAAFHVFRIRQLDEANPQAVDPNISPANTDPVVHPEPDKVETLQELLPESAFIDVEGAKLHYVQAGEGPDLVLLHGIGASIYIWRFLFPLLQTSHRVTAFDFAGFGKSSKEANRNYGLDAQAELISKALTQMGIAKADLVGSSMGGGIALWMGKLWPERFENIIALGPAADSKLLPAFTRHFGRVTPLLRHTVNKYSIKFILNYVVSNRKLINDQVVDAYLAPFVDKGQGLRAFFAATSVLSDRRMPHELKGLKSRTLLVWGARDYLVSRRSMARIRSVLREAQFIEHASGGHHIMEDEPVYVATQIETFLSGSARAVDPRDRVELPKKS